jgi:hypothetical protein
MILVYYKYLHLSKKRQDWVCLPFILLIMWSIYGSFRD